MNVIQSLLHALNHLHNSAHEDRTMLTMEKMNLINDEVICELQVSSPTLVQNGPWCEFKFPTISCSMRAFIRAT